MPALKVGLVGCGVMGQHYARVVTDFAPTEMAAVCDSDPRRAHAFAEAWGVPAVFSSHEEMLHAGGLDAVIVATPDFTHRDPVCHSLEAGLPVLCEKPLATSLRDADAIVAAVRATGSVLMVNFGNRHRANARRVRDLVLAGHLGRVEYVYIRLNERLCKTRTISWLSRTSPVWFLLSHCVDLVRWVLDEDFVDVSARAVHGVAARIAPGVPDVVSALATTCSGVCVNLESCWTMPDAYLGNIDFVLQVIGEDGAIQADLFPHDLALHRHTGAMAQDYSMDVVAATGRYSGWWEDSTRSFFESILAEDLPGPDALEAREVTRTLLAIEASLKAGTAVTVADVIDPPAS